jgi:hypothetical protein
MELAIMWTKFMSWFDDSEVILLARLQVLGSILITAIQGVDWTQLSLVDSDRVWTTAGLLFTIGVLTEVLRRYRATDL